MKLTFLLLLSLTSAIPRVLPAATFYETALSGTNEVPPTGSPATGFAMVTLNGNTLMVNETFSGLIGGSARAAHIHCCGPIGVNEPVVLPFTGFPADTAETYIHSFDLTDVGVYLAPFVAANGGTAAGAEAALVAALNSGQTYANIHKRHVPRRRDSRTTRCGARTGDMVATSGHEPADLSLSPPHRQQKSLSNLQIPRRYFLNTGARVSKIIGLNVEDLRLGPA
jgi:hypothetical protein